MKIIIKKEKTKYYHFMTNYILNKNNKLKNDLKNITKIKNRLLKMYLKLSLLDIVREENTNPSIT